MGIHPPIQILLFYSFAKCYPSLDLKHLQDLQASLNPDYVTGLNVRRQLSLLPDLEGSAGSRLEGTPQPQDPQPSSLHTPHGRLVSEKPRLGEQQKYLSSACSCHCFRFSYKKKGRKKNKIKLRHTTSGTRHGTAEGAKRETQPLALSGIRPAPDR